MVSSTMKKLIVGNVKMHMENPSQRGEYCRALLQEMQQMRTQHTVVMCPPQIYVEYFCRTLGTSPIAIGGQDCFWEYYGSYTGNTSPKTLAALGARYVIVGHSERRTFNHETDDDVAQKVVTALRAELTPIVCVGFLSAEDEMESVRMQVDAVLRVCDPGIVHRVVFAYEPVWAIGTGRTPTSDEIQTATVFIRSLAVQKYGKDVGSKVRVLYGGSVTPDNMVDVCIKAFTDGVLVGKASLSPHHFMGIVRMAG